MDNLSNKQWVWLALDADTREIVGIYIGAGPSLCPSVMEYLTIRSITSVRSYINFCPVYAAVLPSKWYRTVRKKTGKTSYIERFNNTTLRQSVSRLVRITLSNSYVIRESHWCHLVFHSLLQYIITCLVLPQSKS